MAALTWSRFWATWAAWHSSIHNLMFTDCSWTGPTAVQNVCQFLGPVLLLGRRILLATIRPLEHVHELAIMDSALNLALDQARKAGATRVHVIRLRIGVLSGVVPDAL